MRFLFYPLFLHTGVGILKRLANDFSLKADGQVEFSIKSTCIAADQITPRNIRKKPVSAEKSFI